MKTNYSRHKSKEQRNHRVKIYLTLLVLCLVSISCIKQVNLYQPEDEEEEKKDPVYVVENVEDLKIESLMLRPDENEFIYGKVIFEPNNDKTVWTATIKNYQANLSQLKVVFKAVADHITVGNVKQVSGETPNDFRKELYFVCTLYIMNTESLHFQWLILPIVIPDFRCWLL